MDTQSNLVYLAVSGKLGVGKDYVMEHLLLPSIMSGKKVSKMAFADHIKINVASQDRIPIRQMLVGQKSMALRKRLQFEGTENGRDKYYPDIWIDTLQKWAELRSIRDGLDIVLVTDCRFPNEVEFIESNGGLVIRVEAPDRNEIALQQESSDDPVKYDCIKNHRSETALDDYKFEYVFQNGVALENDSDDRFKKILEDWSMKTGHQEDVFHYCSN